MPRAAATYRGAQRNLVLRKLGLAWGMRHYYEKNNRRKPKKLTIPPPALTKATELVKGMRRI